MSRNDGGRWENVDYGLAKHIVLGLSAHGSKVFITAHTADWKNQILVSVDSGEHWKNVTGNLAKLGNNGSLEEDCPITDAGIFVSPIGEKGKRGIYVSSNDGEQWSLSTKGLKMRNNEFTLSPLLADNNVLYGVGYQGTESKDPEEIYVSTNSGGVWNVIRPGLSSFVRLLAVSGSKMYLTTGLTEKKLYLSADRGAHWVKLSEGIEGAMAKVEASAAMAEREAREQDAQTEKLKAMTEKLKALVKDQAAKKEIAGLIADAESDFSVNQGDLDFEDTGDQSKYFKSKTQLEGSRSFIQVKKDSRGTYKAFVCTYEIKGGEDLSAMKSAMLYQNGFLAEINERHQSKKFKGADLKDENGNALTELRDLEGNLVMAINSNQKRVKLLIYGKSWGKR